MNQKIKEKLFYIVLTAVFLIIVSIVCIAGLLKKDQEFSDAENRILAKRPDAAIEKIESGRYMTDYERYINDQFPLRQMWIQLKAGFDCAVGKREANGVYLGTDDYLLEQFKQLDAENEQETLNAIARFSQKYPTLEKYFLLAPNAVNILSEKLPTFAEESAQNAYIDKMQQNALSAGMKVIDVRTPFLENKENIQLYYKTDHHWTSDGAFLAFRCAGPIMGFTPETVSYEILPVTNSFNGTLSSKSGLKAFTKEQIKVYYPISDYQPSIIRYVEEQTEATTFYNDKKLKEKDAYAMFLNGNHGLIKIETPVKDSSKRLLILKDSYANCMLPFLSQYYREIVVVDPRYYYDDINTLIESEEISDLLFLYNANTLSQDTVLKTIIN